MKDKLAIIVPYRDREEHLNVFIPHMHEFLKDKGIDYTIFIAEQTDDRPFNYGKLCNVVTKEVGEDYTYFAFHDIDMLPVSDECDYGYPDSPTHLATNVEAHNNELPYPQYFGGAILISREDFENANGYSNEYWGYGFEDLDLLYRLQRSGAYLEKFYDLNQTYSTYDEDDVLPYRIERVKVAANPKKHKDVTIKLDISSKIYGPINKFTNQVTKDNFFVSFWFNDLSNTLNTKNLFSFEGCDSGVFLSNGRHLIFQLWDENESYNEVSLKYYKNKWNHLVFSKSDDKIILYLNNFKIEKSLPEDFKIYDYTKHCIKISDETSEINLSAIRVFNNTINDEIVNELYYNGKDVLDLLSNKFGLNLVNEYNFNSLYKDKLVLDSGKNLNHLNVYGPLNKTIHTFTLSDEIYLPTRLQGEYKSLVHENDSNIIERYYKYDPDIEENSDIFFHDVLSNNLDYRTIGLSTLKYSILDKQNKETYELIRIVT